MNKPDLERIRKILEDRRDKLAHMLEVSGDYGLDSSLKDSVHELSAYDNHPADLGTETFARELDLGLRDNTRRSLIRVADALERIDQGTYGRCERCGRLISPDRLTAIPDTTLCIDCEEVSESEHDHETRPIEEAVLSPPFGNRRFHRPDDTGIDGEFVWDQVAKLGTSDTPSDHFGESPFETGLYQDTGVVELVDGIVNHEPGEIPPDPAVPRRDLSHPTPESKRELVDRRDRDDWTPGRPQRDKR